MARARIALAELYLQALRLPANPPVDDTAPERPSVPEPPLTFGELDAYWMMFDPYEDEAPVGGSLGSDLAEIYGDVMEGLAFWDAGFHVAAVWTWSFGFGSHWGHHAVSALEAMHQACYRCPVVGE